MVGRGNGKNPKLQPKSRVGICRTGDLRSLPDDADSETPLMRNWTFKHLVSSMSVQVRESERRDLVVHAAPHTPENPVSAVPPIQGRQQKALFRIVLVAELES